MTRGMSRRVPASALVVLWAVIMAAVVVAQGNTQPLSVLMGFVMGSFVLVMKGPAFAVVPMLLSEVTNPAARFQIVSINLSFVAVLGATGLSLVAILREPWLKDPQARRVLLPAVMFVAVSTVVNLSFSNDDYSLRYLRYQIIQLLALVVVGSVLRQRRDLRSVAGMTLAMVVLSAIVAAWQHYAPEAALYAGLDGARVARWEGRSMGLSSSPILLGNQLPSVLVPLLALLAFGPLRRDRTRLVLWAAACVLAIGVVFNATRSVPLAVAVGVVVIGLLLRGKRRLAIFGVLILLGVLYLLLSGTGLVPARFYESGDVSAANRVALWEVGLAMILDNAVIGVGHEQFEELAMEYSDVVSEDVVAVGGAAAVGRDRPHNDFLNVWLSWGILGFAAYVALLLSTLVNCVKAMRSKDVLIHGLAIGCAAGVVAYAVNSSFHNYLDSSIFMWIYAGLSVALARMADKSHRVAWYGRKPRVVRRLAVGAVGQGFRRSRHDHYPVSGQ